MINNILLHSLVYPDKKMTISDRVVDILRIEKEISVALDSNIRTLVSESDRQSAEMAVMTENTAVTEYLKELREVDNDAFEKERRMSFSELSNSHKGRRLVRDYLKDLKKNDKEAYEIESERPFEELLGELAL